ncbi:hypothetical protein OW944_23540 [Klebsiella pneumoniae]
MKLLLIKPNYFGGSVVSEGNIIETDEQHGRELIKKGYAELSAEDTAALPEPEPEPEPEPAKGKNKKG